MSFRIHLDEIMMVRSRADDSIIGVVKRGTRMGVKLTKSDKGWSGEAPVGCIFGYSDRNWVECENETTLRVLIDFIASGQEPFHMRF